MALGPMDKKTENQLYFKAGIAFDHLRLAVQTFEKYVQSSGPDTTPDYYKARNFLRDGEKFFQEALKEAKRLLGPLPPYASAEFEKWRTEFLSRHRIQVDTSELDALKEELSRDGQLDQWIAPEDTERLLAKNYDTQKSGKRKLSNIKVRIILDRLQEYLDQAQDLKKKAMTKLQSGA
ncbi:MAG: hypothetical protein JXE07_03555 [Candidatus Aminicenantes bacterium]|nr:hypothetical protein [Candidatus Aminicenantes bacterium]